MHTHGPWRIVGMERSPCKIMSTGYDTLAHVYLTDPVRHKRTPQHVANAHLIAAAPELLEACKFALAGIDQMGSDWSDEASRKLSAAIALAEGRPCNPDAHPTT